MNVKLVSFIFMLTIVSLEGQVDFKENLEVLWKGLINYAFPKNPDIVRVRKSEDVTTVNNITILDFIGLVERYGYSAEEHYVTTEDGYNLIIHRISESPLSKDRQRKKIVFLQHGILCSSDSWVMFGAGKDLAFSLADEGYDVWLGNIRGNSYCRSHIKMSPRDKDFWQFSYHEVGTKDLPAMIDYILNYTKQKSLHYIGHSMGTTALFVLLSMRPEYNAKIELGICLAPVAIWKKIPPLIQFLQSQEQIIKVRKYQNCILKEIKKNIFYISST
ncbi:PREDICTED: lipase 1-like, partial [Wasmannia auropunctata]|uniref:lipase 1-like n=1 Tax=Wasmannia auropunctata TaxID=64793 RepID=UPI0005F09A20